MNISKKLILIMFVWFSSGLIHAETDVWITLSTVVVTGTRVAQTFPQMTRQVSVINKDEIKS